MISTNLHYYKMNFVYADEHLPSVKIKLNIKKKRSGFVNKIPHFKTIK